jgi:uncharacterized membrane protein YkvA (DUF1232 family)
VFPIVSWIDDGLAISLLVAEVSQIVKEKLQEKSVLGAETTIPASKAAVDANAAQVD